MLKLSRRFIKMQSTITANEITYKLPNGRILFNKVSFSLNKKLTALVGPNGVGKTCLAKLIQGDLSPHSGTIRKTETVTFFSQREKPPEISVTDYLLNNYSWSVLGEKLLEGIDQNILCSRLSGGEWMRVRLAYKINKDFLILDEPTNDLDREAKLILKDFLKKYLHGILLISHDREFLNLCEDILELSNQGLTKYGGGWSTYEEEKERERIQLSNNLERAKREREKAKTERFNRIDKQERRNRQGKRAAKKGGMPKILLGARKRQAESTTGEVDSSTMDKANIKVKEAIEAFNQIKPDPVMYAHLTGTEIPKQKLVAEAKEFNIFLKDWLYENDLNFSWRGNIRIAIKGANGSGKTTLIKALMGEKFKTRGKLSLGKLTTVYLDQQCSILKDSLNVIENVSRVSRMSESEIRNALAKLLFFDDSVFQKVHSLSGGERLRAGLACGLLQEEKPQLIIFDEPTNNLDLSNIHFLENLITQFKGAVLIVSHDDIFLKKCGINMELNLLSGARKRT